MTTPTNTPIPSAEKADMAYNLEQLDIAMNGNAGQRWRHRITGEERLNFADAAADQATLALNLADATDPAKGPGMVGVDMLATYPVLTVGRAITNNITVRDLIDSGMTATEAIQYKLNAGGRVFIEKPTTPEYVVSDTLIVHSNTDLVIEPGTIIKQAAGVNKSLLVNYAKTQSWAIVTGQVYWADYGNTEKVLITWVGNNCSVGDAIWLDCEGSAEFCGVFTVIAKPSVNDVEIRLHRRPAANPVGVCRIRKADTNISITGGMFDYNRLENGDGTQSPNAHAVYIAGVRGLKIDNLQAKNTKKYVVAAQGVRDYEINAGGYALNSDIVKIYGPAFSGKISAFGYPGDDMMSLQTCEPAQFIAYQIGYGGDIIGVVGIPKMDFGAFGLGVLSSIYPHSWGGSIIDDITIKDHFGFCENAAVQIYDQEGTGGKIGTIRLLNINATCESAVYAFQKVSGGPTGPTQINRLEVSIGNEFKNRTGADIIQIGAGVSVDTLVDAGSTFASVANTIGNGSYMNVSGDVARFVFNNTKVKYTSNYFLRLDTSAKAIKSVEFNSADIEVANVLLKFSPVSDTGTPLISFIGGTIKGYGVLETESSAKVMFNGTRIQVTNEVVWAGGANSAVVEIDSSVGLAGGTGEWWAVAGDAKVSPRSFEILANPFGSGVAKLSGNRCTANVAAGTIPVNTPVICAMVGATPYWCGMADPLNQRA